MRDRTKGECTKYVVIAIARAHTECDTTKKPQKSAHKRIHPVGALSDWSALITLWPASEYAMCS